MNPFVSGGAIRFIWSDKLDLPEYPTIYITLGTAISTASGELTMDISFQWNGDAITSEQTARVEENIREEMPNLIERFPEPPNNLVVHLFANVFFSSLEGVATDPSGRKLVKFTYALAHPCLREYFYLGQSCSNES